MISIAAIDAAGSVTQRIRFNRTFSIDQISNSYRLNPVSSPRAHGDRLPEGDAWLSGRSIVLTGYIGTGVSSGEVGTPNRTTTGGSVMGIVADTTTAPAFLAELRLAMARLHQQRTVILDYGNGWSQYVKIQQIGPSQIEEGYPDLRKFTVMLYAGDPRGYGPVVAGDLLDAAGGLLSVAAYSGALSSGLAPSPNWALTLLPTGGPLVVRVGNAAGASMTVTLKLNQVLVVDAYRRTLYFQQEPTVPAWAQWASGSVFWDLNPNSPTNHFHFTDAVTGDPIVIDLDVAGDMKVGLLARAADWLPERVDVADTTLEASYGIAQYGVDMFG